MLVFKSVLVLTALLGIPTAYCNLWAWECRGDAEAAGCVKVRKTENSKASLSRCRLTCGPYGSLFPRPKQASIGDDVFYFHPNKIVPLIHDSPDSVRNLINDSINDMKDKLAAYTPSKQHPPLPDTDTFKDNILFLVINVPGSDEHLTLTTNESYTLDIYLSKNMPHALTVNIAAPNFFGAHHGLETLSQLVSYDERVRMYEIVDKVHIVDAPAYPYRGIIVDTCRNFIPLKLLMKTIDAMAQHKLNTFHWHIVDSGSFPMALQSLPNMTLYGAYGPDQVYSKEDIKSLVRYAKARGIRVLPEFDAPAHVGYGWDWGPEAGLGDLVVCLGRQPWTSYCPAPPCGQFNLANVYSYKVLAQIYKDMVELFAPIDLFHYGGDEVDLNCWNSTEEIVNWMVDNGYPLDDDSYYNQWSVFQEKARQLLIEANKGVEVPGVIWTSSLTEMGHTDQYLDKNKYIIQIWTSKENPQIKEILEKGYKVIISNHDALYFDIGFASYVGAGARGIYSGWQNVYDNNLRNIVEDMTNSTKYFPQILGGEGAMWTELIDEHNFEGRMWPRAAALAERLWTDPDTDYSYAEPRMLSNRERMVKRGVEADKLQPGWCCQNYGECRDPRLPKP